MTPAKLAVDATIQAPLAKVWDYYTNPDHITQWNTASEDWYCPSATNDLRIGGKFTSRMEARDGSAGFDFEGVYDEVVEQKKFAYTMDDGRQARVDFEDLDGSTKVTVIFDAETENSLEMQQQGWQAILDEFRKYTESN